MVKSSSDVRSLTYCDLQCISLNGLKQTLRMYPELAEQCATDLLHDLTYNLRDGFTEPDNDDTMVIPAVTLRLSDDGTPTIKVSSKCGQFHMLNINCRVFAVNRPPDLSREVFIQVAQLSERDRAAGLVNYGQK